MASKTLIGIVNENEGSLEKVKSEISELKPNVVGIGLPENYTYKRESYKIFEGKIYEILYNKGFEITCLEHPKLWGGYNTIILFEEGFKTNPKAMVNGMSYIPFMEKAKKLKEELLEKRAEYSLDVIKQKKPQMIIVQNQLAERIYPSLSDSFYYKTI